MRYSTAEVAEITAGVVVGEERVVVGAAIDSRSIAGQELFVPLRDNRDGHDWIQAALDAGAAAYLTERAPIGGTAVMVDNTFDALTALGASARSRLTAQIIGVTGSVGKTTTKDMIRAILATTLVTQASVRSFNNEIGVPLTLLTAGEDTEALVVEMGARAPGDIAALCEIVRPSIGVVTRVAPVHVEGFGSVDGVARTKAELVQALPPGGTAVLNADDPRVAAMAGLTSADVVLFGTTGLTGPPGAAGQVRAELLDLDGDLRPLVRITTPSDTFEVRLEARGAHQVHNAAAAAAVGYVCGVPATQIAAALHDMELSPLRMSLAVGLRGIQVLDDSYNANPASVAAALQSLAALPARRRIAVLGVMAELGPVELAEHRRMADLAQTLGIEVLAVNAPQYGVESVGMEDLLDRLDEVTEGDAVLVKGSRVAGLETFAAQLKDNHRRVE
jgi:UDP-N-acetylmuramoyl-tripeptide--D-alanyl-D-alanine ligase